MSPEREQRLPTAWQEPLPNVTGRGIKRLRIYIDEAAYFDDRKVFEVVMARARASSLAGATLTQAIVGFGSTPAQRQHTLLDDDQSVIVEILDDEQKLRAFVQSLSDLDEIGPIILEAVELLRWKPVSAQPLQAIG